MRTAAFDLDDTLIDTFTALSAWARGNGRLPRGSVLAGYHELLPEIINDWHLGEAERSVAAVVEAREACAFVAGAGFRLCIVTSRHPRHSRTTCDLVDALFPGVFSEIACVGLEQGKAKALAAFGAELFVDDVAHHVREAEEAGIPSLLFGDLPWNRSARHERRALDWKAAAPMLAELAAPREVGIRCVT